MLFYAFGDVTTSSMVDSLSSEEYDQYCSLTKKNQTGFLISRNLLKNLIIEHCLFGFSPKDVIIKNGKNGEPYVLFHEEIKISISHDSIVFVAISDESIGIDVINYGRANSIRSLDQFAKRILSFSELINYSNLAGQSKSQYLLNQFSKKEAYYKLVNEPLSFDKIDIDDIKSIQIEKINCFSDYGMFIIIRRSNDSK